MPQCLQTFVRKSKTGHCFVSLSQLNMGVNSSEAFSSFVDFCDSHQELPLVAYTLKTSVWVLTHVWNRRTSDCLLFPR